MTIATALLLASFCAPAQEVPLPNSKFESGTLAGWTLEQQTVGSVVTHVGSLPPIQGNFSGLIEPHFNPGTVAVASFFAILPPGSFTAFLDARVLADTLPAENVTLTLDIVGVGTDTKVITPSDFSPIAVPEGPFILTTGVITLSVSIPDGGGILVRVTLDTPATEPANFGVLIDNFRIIGGGGPPTFQIDPCVFHTGRGFAPFRNPAFTCRCAGTVSRHAMGPSLPTVAIPRLVDPNDGSLSGSAVELHTGSFTFNTFT